MFTLYTTALSANGRKVLAASIHLGLEPEVRLVNVYRGEGRTPEYLAINPTGKIPVLVDQELTLSESNAILIYLAEARGDFRLFSRKPERRAAIMSWLFWESAHWQPALTPVLAPLVGHKLKPQAVPAPTAPPDWGNQQIRPLLERLEAQLESSAFLAGDELTIADFSVAGMMTYFRATAFPFRKFPHIDGWYGRLEALPAWQDTAAELWS